MLTDFQFYFVVTLVTCNKNVITDFTTPERCLLKYCLKNSVPYMLRYCFQQEAQLPLRNRASAMHFFEVKLLYITVMTYNCV